MLRILIIIAVIALLFGLMSRFMRSKVQENPEKTRLESSKMVKCAYCELYVGLDEALKSGDKYYCSEQHKSLEQHKAE